MKKEMQGGMNELIKGWRNERMDEKMKRMKRWIDEWKNKIKWI